MPVSGAHLAVDATFGISAVAGGFDEQHRDLASLAEFGDVPLGERFDRFVELQRLLAKRPVGLVTSWTGQCETLTFSNG